MSDFWTRIKNDTAINWRTRSGLLGTFVPFHPADGLFTQPYNGCVLVGAAEHMGAAWVRIRDADDAILERRFSTIDDAREFVTRLPSVIDFAWLKANKFL